MKRTRYVFDYSAEIGYVCGMWRQARNAPGGLVYHVLNRANGRLLQLGKKNVAVGTGGIEELDEPDGFAF